MLGGGGDIIFAALSQHTPFAILQCIVVIVVLLVISSDHTRLNSFYSSQVSVQSFFLLYMCLFFFVFCLFVSYLLYFFLFFIPSFCFFVFLPISFLFLSFLVFFSFFFSFFSVLSFFVFFLSFFIPSFFVLLLPFFLSFSLSSFFLSYFLVFFSLSFFLSFFVPSFFVFSLPIFLLFFHSCHESTYTVRLCGRSYITAQAVFLIVSGHVLAECHGKVSHSMGCAPKFGKVTTHFRQYLSVFDSAAQSIQFGLENDQGQDYNEQLEKVTGKRSYCLISL